MTTSYCELLWKQLLLLTVLDKLSKIHALMTLLLCLLRCVIDSVSVYAIDLSDVRPTTVCDSKRQYFLVSSSSSLSSSYSLSSVVCFSWMIMMLLVFYVGKQASHKKLERSQQTTKILTLPTGCALSHKQQLQMCVIFPLSHTSQHRK